MIGVSLSRWTMSFFAAALLALLAAEVLMLAGFGYPADPVEAPRTLILVHLVALGWLSLLMAGALLQFLPVLVARPLYSDRLALPTLLALLAGLGLLLAGFAGLGGGALAGLPLLGWGAALLALGFALLLWNLVRTLVVAPSVPLPTRFVVAGLLSLILAVALGAGFAVTLQGATSAGWLVELLLQGLPLHIVAGLGGWLTFTAVGVSYRLLAMFMLSPELDRPTTRWALWLGCAALLLAVPGGILAILLGWSRGLELALGGAALASVLAVVLYGIDAVHLFRARRRPRIELNSRMAAAALLSLGAAAVLGVVLLALGRLGAQAGALLFLLAFGWLSGLGLAQLYKITAFLTWLESFGPMMGKGPTPRVQDLVVEARAERWFQLYFLAVWLGTLLLLAGQAAAFRLAAAAMLAGTAGIAVQLWRTRRLSVVRAGPKGLPKGAVQPRLLLAQGKPAG